ncbi:putative sterigmatocystin biosynthesismonooxygenase stcF [Colletotrichum tanaceti]|uniref:Putative sterigmatocystin biosynthesismonooxygenase stcF n=1 Tax=Colletotrichum tanaceti TaxID=1306861 RepID=A0A4U6X7V6_9PEZI|nr:putative sterigmatocystin biosynthesismonooxygenase stcF [Colletotrichum tanaceti]TKW51590.1 putative sterigmatocystin biosynthesismonooxygenase stcF [Colletotrichum tanaceti]
MDSIAKSHGLVSKIALLPPLSLWAVTKLTLVGAVVSVFAVVFYNYFLHPVAHVKGPLLAAISPIWIVRSVAGHRLNRDIEALHRKYGPVVRVAPNELSFATESSLKAVHNPGPSAGGSLFTKKGTSEEMILRLVFPATNLLTVQDDAAHKTLRTALQPAFTAKALRDQEEITQQHVQATVDALAAAAAETPGTPISLTRELGKMIWGIVGHLSFGQPLSIDQLDNYDHRKDLHAKVASVMELFQYLASVPVIGSMIIFSVVTYRKLFGSSQHILGKQELDSHIASRRSGKDFLSAILAAKDAAHLTQDELYSNMTLLLMGGYDSSYVTLSAVFYHLLSKPEHYRRLQSALRRDFASADDISCVAVLQQPLLNACINEALRLVPPINGHGSHRVAAAGAAIEGIWVPAGTLVSADIYTIQRDPRCWAFADEYRPERWLDESNGPGTPFAGDVRTAWRPFSLGPRACIGREMALQSIRLAVAKIVFLFDLTLENRDMVWDRDVGSHFLWHDFDVRVKVDNARG